MKKLLIVFILFPICFLYWCEKQVSEDLNVEKSAIIQYCESNGWFIAETDSLVCYFSNSSCDALDFYNWDCQISDWIKESYNEEIAIQRCNDNYWIVNSIESEWNESKICLFPNQSVCTLNELFYWECIAAE